MARGRKNTVNTPSTAAEEASAGISDSAMNEALAALRAESRPKPQKKKAAKKGKSGEPARKPYYIEVTLKRGGHDVAKVAARRNSPKPELTWTSAVAASDVENLILSAVNLFDDDGKHVGTLDPNYQGWEYVANLHKANIGHQFVATEPIEIDE